MSQQTAIRRAVLTGAVASITAVGAIYGAGLKSRQDYKKVIIRVVQCGAASQLLSWAN